jgi:hypothetical protein
MTLLTQPKGRGGKWLKGTGSQEGWQAGTGRSVAVVVAVWCDSCARVATECCQWLVPGRAGSDLGVGAWSRGQAGGGERWGAKPNREKIGQGNGMTREKVDEEDR